MNKRVNLGDEVSNLRDRIRALEALVSAVPADTYGPYITAGGDQMPTVVVAGPCTLKGWAMGNDRTTPIYVKFYDKATTPLSSDTPATTFRLPAKMSANLLDGAGITFDVGLSFRVTTGVANSNTGSPAASDGSVSLFVTT